MNTWIIQGNLNFFDIVTGLKDYNETLWECFDPLHTTES